MASTRVSWALVVTTVVVTSLSSGTVSSETPLIAWRVSSNTPPSLINGIARAPTSSTNARAAMSPATSPTDMRPTLSRPPSRPSPALRHPHTSPASPRLDSDTPPRRRVWCPRVHNSAKCRLSTGSAAAARHPPTRSARHPRPGRGSDPWSPCPAIRRISTSRCPGVTPASSGSAGGRSPARSGARRTAASTSGRPPTPMTRGSACWTRPLCCRPVLPSAAGQRPASEGRSSSTARARAAPSALPVLLCLTYDQRVRRGPELRVLRSRTR